MVPREVETMLMQKFGRDKKRVSSIKHRVHPSALCNESKVSEIALIKQCRHYSGLINYVFSHCKREFKATRKD